jgi:hypothetical protein
VKQRKRAVAALLAAGALALGAVGCGDDEDDSDPTISVPEVTTSESVPETTTVPPAPTETTGGTGTPTVAPTGEDSESNDVPPPPGSPQAKFEQACKQNPAVCAD